MSAFPITELADDRAFEKHHRKPFPNRYAHTRAVRKEIAAMGHVFVPAHHDEAGNCIYCGEAGRCPGVHAKIEIVQNN